MALTNIIYRSERHFPNIWTKYQECLRLKYESRYTWHGNPIVNITDIDFNNVSKWSKRWLVKLDPDKTEILVFDWLIVGL